MNEKAQRLSNILKMPIENIQNIDRGMWDILIELNSKNYFTNGCCEGHLREDGKWNGYISFINPYVFNEYPKLYDHAKHRMTFYWTDIGENSRQKFLEELYEWAKNLPVREVTEIKTYTLWGKNKRRPNGNWHILKCSSNYEDIKIELNRKQTEKYELKFEEKIIGRY